MSKEEEKKIDDDNSQFSGWESPDDIDFFGTGGVEPKKEETKKVVDEINEDDDLEKEDDPKEEEPKEEKDTETKKEQEVKDNLFIDEFDKDDEDESEKKKETKESKEKPSGKETKEKGEKVTPSTTLNFLKEKGLVTFELDEGEELTDEKAEEILEDSYEDSIEDRVEELMTGLPDVVKNMVKFAKDGGDVEKLLGTISSKNETGISEGLDLEKEANQEKVVRHQLKANGFDKDTIDAQIEFFKESGKLEATAEKFYEDILDKQKKEYKKLLKAQDDMKLKNKESKRNYRKRITEALNNKESDFKGLQISRKDKSSLPGYISEPSVKMSNGNVVTELQRDIFEVLKNPQKTIMLSQILKTDFDFSSITKGAKTEKAKEVKKELEHTETKTPRTKSGSTRSQRSLAEYF